MLFDGTLSPYGLWADGPVEFDPEASSRDLVTTLHTWWGDLHGRNDMVAAAEVTAIMDELAVERDDDLLRLAALMTAGFNLLQEGRLAEARDAFAGMEDLSAHVTIPELVFTPDPRVGGPLFEGVARLLGGDLEAADRLSRVADGRAKSLGDPVAQSYVDGIRVFQHVWRTDADAVRRAVAVLDGNAQAQNMHMIRVYLQMPRAWAVAVQDVGRGAELADTALAEIGAPVGMVWRPFFLAVHAEVMVWAGRLDDAHASIDRALAEAVVSGAHGNDALLHRLRAQVLRAEGAPDDEVAQEIERGLAVAREQGAQLFVRQLEAL
jgi:hypothetical protein